MINHLTSLESRSGGKDVKQEAEKLRMENSAFPREEESRMLPTLKSTNRGSQDLTTLGCMESTCKCCGRAPLRNGVRMKKARVE